MVEVITVLYENGVLRPLTPVKLREHQRVRIQIISEEAIAPSERPREDANQHQAVERLIQRLVNAGLMAPRISRPVPPDPVSEEERRELADLMGSAPGKPLSEIIMEERDEL